VYGLASAAVSDDPKLKDAYAARAVELLGQPLAQALTNMERLQQDQDFAPLRGREDFQKLARTAEATQALDQAIADWTEVIRTSPTQAGAYVNRGVRYAWKGELDKAIADFTQVVKLDPQDVRAHALRAEAHVNKRDFAKAIADLTKVLQLEPQDARTFFMRGSAHSQQGAYHKSIPDFTEAIRLGLNTICTWDLATGRELHTLKGQTYHVHSVAFSPDGKRLASCGMDGMVKL
jgi:tetratricopeptide (TPR) repeat protein